MELLHRGEFLSRAACDDMLAILKKEKPGSIRAGLPEAIPVAFKPGAIAGVATEWAIVSLEARPYVLVVMQNLASTDEATAAAPITEVARAVHEYFSRRASASPYGTYVEPRLLQPPR
jgi:beta-lactamase class A